MCAYNAQEHRFRFAAWAAGRAYSRGQTGLSVQAGKYALEETGLKRFALGLTELPKSSDEFDEGHSVWCEAIIEKFHELDTPLKYGRAAKLINVYLKTLFLSDFGKVAVNGLSEAELLQRANAVHPPIDRLLLDALSNTDDQNAQFWRANRACGWTNFNKERYLNVIEHVKRITDGKLWMIEEHWAGVDGGA